MNPTPTSAATPALTPQQLIDPVCGVVTHIADFAVPPGAPDGYRSSVAAVADTRQFAVWLADRVGGGTSWRDREQADTAALGEAVERYCGNHIPPGLIRSSQRDLRARGLETFGPAELPAFSDEQLRRPGFGYRAWDADTELLWAIGRGDADQDVAVPAAAVYLNWRSGSRRNEPRILHLQYSGIATGTSLADAADRAVAECLERDATVGWWTLGLPATPIDIGSVPGLSQAWGVSPLELKLVALPSDCGLPVIGALVFDHHNALPAAGFSAHPDPVVAALKAAGEAVQVWTSGHGLLTADGRSYQAIETGLFARHCYLEHRDDRRYLDAAAEDLRNIRDLAAHAQLWLDPRLHPLLSRFDGVGDPVPITAIASGSIAAARQWLAADGHRTATFDLTTADVAETGWRVARVTVSGLITNAPAAFGYLGTPRLHRLADRYGVTDLTIVPPPHN